MATPIPENRADFSLYEIGRATGVEVPARVDPQLRVHGVGTDSRQALHDKLFVALCGERFDGHDHVARAVAAGALAALVERRTGAAVPEFVVPSTLAALGALARYHRERTPMRMVAVAGAAGKTTTRAVTEALLRAELGDGVLATPGNLNNRVGVPMVLLSAERGQSAAVIEIGTNQLGEVPALTHLARPEVALLTLIALEHSEGLGDLDGVEREEAGIFSHRPEVAIGNADDVRVRRVLEAAHATRKLSYGFASDADYAITALASHGTHSELELRTPRGSFNVSLPWLARPLATAIAGGLAAAESVLERPLLPSLVKETLLRSPWRQPGRFRVKALADGTLLVDDSYNSNPASLRAALSSTRELAAGRGSAFHLVLGEMRELGTLSEPEHRSIGRELGSLGAASVTAIAGDARYFLAPDAFASADAERAPDGFFDDCRSAEGRVLLNVRAGDVVLVKGSRGVRCDEIVRVLEATRGLVNE
jgi:UDP-N-acetylmuramoyl-tripeptide--D-alanyl-D-alanine ligase